MAVRFMYDREYRLRLRIDALIDEREALRDALSIMATDLQEARELRDIEYLRLEKELESVRQSRNRYKKHYWTYRKRLSEVKGYTLRERIEPLSDAP